MLASVVEAARAAGVSPRTVQRMIASGALAANAARLVDVERVRALAALPRSRWLALGDVSVADASPRGDSSALELMRLELERTTQERDKFATLHADSARLLAAAQAQLAASERVELATARRCDRLETRLQDAHKESLALARHIGALESERAALARLDLPRKPSFLARLFFRSSR